MQFVHTRHLLSPGEDETFQRVQSRLTDGLFDNDITSVGERSRYMFCRNMLECNLSSQASRAPP
jgi:hypothetical protein